MRFSRALERSMFFVRNPPTAVESKRASFPPHSQTLHGTGIFIPSYIGVVPEGSIDRHDKHGVSGSLHRRPHVKARRPVRTSARGAAPVLRRIRQRAATRELSPIPKPKAVNIRDAPNLQKQERQEITPPKHYDSQQFVKRAIYLEFGASVLEYGAAPSYFVFLGAKWGHVPSSEVEVVLGSSVPRYEGFRSSPAVFL